MHDMKHEHHVQAQTHGRHAGHTVEDFRKRFWISILATIPVLILTPELHELLGIGGIIKFTGQNYLLFVLSSFVYFYGGYPFLQGLVRELREKQPGMMTLIGVAITVAYVYSSATVFGLSGMPFFWELATLIDIMLLGHWLEMKSILGASQSKRTGGDSFLSQVIDLVRQAQESKSRTQDLSNRVAFWLTIIALSVGIITFIAWSVVFGKDISFSLERAVTVMVIACPHALGLAVPLVVAVSTSIAANNGLLIRDRLAFENARQIDAVIFDKTGTLTEGRFGVTDIITFNDDSNEKPGPKTNGLSESDILKYAASVEAYSEHPIAISITEATKERFSVTNFRNITGEGAQASVEINGLETDVKIVSPGYLTKHGIDYSEAQEVAVKHLSAQGKTVVVLLIDNRPAGAIALADIIRPESRKAIDDLKAMGVRCMMITGDTEEVARSVSGELGIDEFFAGVLPQRKADQVKEVQSRGLVVAMTGDGVNDAPALAQADVGIAIGSGTDVAVETADIILVRNNPQDVVNIIKLARSTYSKMFQNLAWATGYNAFAIPLAAGVLYGYGILLSPAFGAVLMSASTIIVAFNAKLLRMEK
ncbi:MAG: copper-translocating P-type ATPase [Rubrobacteridae bacterium]|nr:copper-translocating P-type ATPase [Rubrobacteridae bacterium]